MKTLLRNSIINAPYFKELYLLKNFQEVNLIEKVIEEIQKKAIHVEPWTAGLQIPSTAFCCLYKLMILRLTGKHNFSI